MPRPPPTPCPNCAPGPRAAWQRGTSEGGKLVQVESGGGFVRSAHHASHPHPGAHSAYAHEVPLRAAAERLQVGAPLLLVDHGEEVGAPPPPTPPAPPGPVGRGMPPPG